MPMSRWASSIVSVICAETSAPVPKTTQVVWALIMFHLFSFFHRDADIKLWIWIYRVMNDLWPLCSTAGTGSPVASSGTNLPFCHVLLRGAGSLWIVSSEILAFIPALKGWGVPQGWCLILAAFVHSGLGKSCMLWSLLCLQQPWWHLRCEKAPTQIWPVNLKV